MKFLGKKLGYVEKNGLKVCYRIVLLGFKHPLSISPLKTAVILRGDFYLYISFEIKSTNRFVGSAKKMVILSNSLLYSMIFRELQ